MTSRPEMKPRAGRFLSVHGCGHPVVRVSHSSDCHGIRHNIFRQGHSRISGISDMMNIRAGHFAHEGDPPYGINIRALLRGSDGRDGKRPSAMGMRNQLPDIFHSDSRHSSRCRKQDDIRTRINKFVNILPGDNVFAALARYPRGMHLSGGKDQPVLQPGGYGLQRIRDGLIAHAVAWIHMF